MLIKGWEADEPWYLVAKYLEKKLTEIKWMQDNLINLDPYEKR